MKPHIMQAKQNGASLKLVGNVVRFVCFVVACTALFALYSCLTLVKDEAKEVKNKLEQPTVQE